MKTYVLGLLESTVPYIRTIDLWVCSIGLIGAFFIAIAAVRTLHELKTAVKCDPDFKRETCYMVNKVAAIMIILWCIFYTISCAWKITMYSAPQTTKETRHDETMRCLQGIRQTNDDVLVRPDSPSNSVHGVLEGKEDRPECTNETERVDSRSTADVG